jgi:hypothetical protein
VSFDDNLPPELQKYLPDRERSKRLRSAAGKVMRAFAQGIQPLGFTRRSTFFFKGATAYVVPFIHVHKYSFGPSFRVHACIRVLNDPTPFLGLNGIADSSYVAPFDFAEEPRSIAQCADEMVRYVRDVAEPWFGQRLEMLVEAEGLLGSAARQALREALAGQADAEAVTRSLGACIAGRKAARHLMQCRELTQLRH